MGFYQARILPYLVNLAMRNRRLLPYRERVISGAEGRVLEIGIGSGLNLPFYSSQARDTLGLSGMGVFGLVILVLVLLAIAALVKYVFFR
ncbi:MAG TPA: hypothetical protein VFA65_22990 [Bryobacteraceae bacterium]|nr:hypothetical protein [Bryobacteraceae bacterium]